MIKRFSLYLSLITISLFFSACGQADDPPPPEEDTDQHTEDDGELPLLQDQTVPYTTEAYVLGIAFPTGMVWAPDGRLFVAEKSGTVRVISAEGELQADPVIAVPTNQEGEQGLLGITIDPNFAENGYIWLYHTWGDPDNERPGEVWHRVVRFTELDGVGSDVQVALELKDRFTESTILNGGGITFGPDGMIYLSPGSSNNILTVTDRDAAHGKMLRMTPTIPAEPAPDNIREDSMIWAYGLRNSFGITFHPESGFMYATENGPDCDDEINRIIPGGDHGWRIDGLCEDHNLSPDDYPGRFVPPVLAFTPTISPTGIMFYTGDVFPEWHHDMFYCAYNLGKVYRVKLAENGVDIIGAGDVNVAPARCATSINTGPDGFIYFSDLAGIYRIIRTGG